ncbi:MAG: hypothetical protein AAF446_05485 [Pseudomonadota bacterium]
MLSKIQRCWLMGLRMAWRFRNDHDRAEQSIDALLEANGLKAAGCCMVRLIHALQGEGATHLDFEHSEHTPPTGDERDVLNALRCCYLDDALGAETALGALLPPGAGSSALRAANDIAMAHRLNMRCSHSFSFDWPRRDQEHDQNRNLPSTSSTDGAALPIVEFSTRAAE